MGHPDPALSVHHRVMWVPGIVPDELVAPIDRRLEVLLIDIGPEVTFSWRVAHRDCDLPGLVCVRIDGNQFVIGEFDAVDRATSVDLRGALVGRNLVVDVAGRATPFPHRQHYVALGSFGPGRRRRHLASHDPVGPVSVHRDGGIGTESPQPAVHQSPALTGLHTVGPSGFG